MPYGRVSLPAPAAWSRRKIISVHRRRCAPASAFRAKATTLEGLARAVTEGQIDLDGVVRKEAAAALSELVALRGIGPWTAEVYLMFCGGHPDIFPVGDVALRSAVAHALDLEVRPEAKWLAERAALWSPWRSVAARLFWGYYANIMRRAMVPLP